MPIKRGEVMTRSISGRANRIKMAPGTAALMFLVAGILAVACTYTPIAHRSDLRLLRALGVTDVLLAAIVYVLPWERWPDKALLVIPVGALAMIGVFESSGALTPYTYPIFFIVVFVWMGLCTPPGTSFMFFPLAAVAYLVPVWGDANTVGARDSAFIVLPVCVLIAEVISRALSSVRVAHGGVTRLLGAAKALTGVSSTEEGTDRLAGQAHDLLGGDAVVVFLADPARPERFIASASRNVPPAVQGMVIDTDLEPSEVGAALRRGETLFVGDDVLAHMNPRLQQPTRAQAGVFFPLPGGDRNIGSISVLWTRSRTGLDPFAREAIELLSLVAGRVLDRLQATARLSLEAERDSLTGLLNRRSFQRALQAAAPGDALVAIDLDYFKVVNDRHGHAEGDKTLASFAQCLQSAARASDAVARLGGEEFVVLLSESGEEGAAAVVERVKGLWAATSPRTSFSAGIAVHQSDESVEDTLQRADAALYAAKNAGRNRMEISTLTVA